MNEELEQLKKIFITGSYDAFLEKEAEIEKIFPNIE
jgi:hypothetical protein